MNSKPRISVITASKNIGRFIRPTIETILRQSFGDYEHIVSDGASTDNTIEILKEYKHIRWISEPDRHPDEGFYKALMMSCGEYIMFSCISDGYLDQDWFQKCVEVMDNDSQVSLVYGLAQCMNEDGKLGKIVFSNFLKQLPPQKQHFLPFSHLSPQRSFCM